MTCSPIALQNTWVERDRTGSDRAAKSGAKRDRTGGRVGQDRAGEERQDRTDKERIRQKRTGQARVKYLRAERGEIAQDRTGCRTG